MSSRKRKAEDAEDASTGHPKKKSKAQLRNEAKARAARWAEEQAKLSGAPKTSEAKKNAEDSGTLQSLADHDSDGIPKRRSTKAKQPASSSSKKKQFAESKAKARAWADTNSKKPLEATSKEETEALAIHPLSATSMSRRKVSPSMMIGNRRTNGKVSHPIPSLNLRRPKVPSMIKELSPGPPGRKFQGATAVEEDQEIVSFQESRPLNRKFTSSKTSPVIETKEQPSSIEIEPDDVLQTEPQSLDEVTFKATRRTQFTFKRVKMALFVASFIGACTIGIVILLKHTNSLEADEITEIRPPCFISNRRNEIIEDARIPNATTDFCAEPQIPCPLYGVCFNGLLQGCNESYLEMASSGAACIVDHGANESLSLLEHVLQDWTTQCKCSLVGVPFSRKAGKKGTTPYFPLENLKEAHAFDHVLLRHSQNIEVIHGDNSVDVGLTDDFVENSLVLPFYCFLGLHVLTFLKVIASLFAGVLGTAAKAIWTSAIAYPLVSVSCLCIMIILHYLRRSKLHQRQITKDVARVRQLVYEILMNNPGNHAVLHIRDEIADQLYPESADGRLYLKSTVWTRVSKEVRQDNRVSKSSQFVNGRPRDVWKWEATMNGIIETSDNTIKFGKED